MIKKFSEGRYNHFVGIKENFNLKVIFSPMESVTFLKGDIIGLLSYKSYDKKSNILAERFEGVIEFENQELCLFSPVDVPFENNEYYALFYDRLKNKFYTIGENNVRFYKDLFPLEINLKYYDHLESQTIKVPDVRTLKIPEKKSEPQTLF